MHPGSAARPDRAELEEVLTLVAREARQYLEQLDERDVGSAATREAPHATVFPALPEEGVGAAAALRELLVRAEGALVHSSGPRCYHFVMGGVTPAALGADWLTSLYDQIAYAGVTSPLAVELELLALRWLAELFDLPETLQGVMTTGATMANFVCLAAAREWWAAKHGVSAGKDGLHALPVMPVLSSGLIHASSRKCLGMLGLGRASVQTFASDARGTLDAGALEDRLRALKGAPALVIANAGEVNAGAFDPIEVLADLCERHGCWLHVDGAFGLFARLSPRTRHLTVGVERADSVTVDGHKWLNVPYDCGFAFVKDLALSGSAFAYAADYLPRPDDPRPNLGSIGPESSRRARSLAVWSTLKAYGRRGHQAVVEEHLDLAQKLAARVDAAPDLERLADVPLNIVCFRFRPAGFDEPQLDRLNERLGEELLRDGRYYAGTTRYAGKVAFRPALVNWRIRDADLEGFVRVVCELGRRLGEEA